MGPPRSKRTRASTTTMPDDEDLSPISCELCRQRKCKCDRKVPFCSQCSSEPSKCIYPESGKRGLPLGYLNQLEQRLTETEAALYGALVTLRSMNSTTVVPATAKPDSVHKPKAARMDEWSKLPLQTWSDMDRWQAAIGDQFNVEQPQARPFTESSGGGDAMPISPTANPHSPQGDVEVRRSALYAWQPKEDIHMRRPYETHPRPPGVVSPPVYSRDQASGSGVTSPDRSPEFTNVTGPSESRRETDQSTMADELSKSKPGIYF